MNNYSEITIDGKKVGLTFGMAAAEEFYSLMGEETNGTMQTANVIYAAACNEALLNRQVRPDYRMIAEWVDEAYMDNGDMLVELNKACEIFNESRFGKNVNQATENIKKKVAELESQNQSTGTK